MENGGTAEHVIDCPVLKSVERNPNRTLLIIPVRNPSGRSE